jgi:tRNA(fMet)-specific endonuclease VapC
LPYLLDTNIVSFILKNPRGVAAERFRMTSADQLFVSSVVEAELRFGAQRMPVGARVPRLLDVFLSEISILTWDSHCARQHAMLRNLLERTPLSWPDSMIAAHALALDYTLVTNDSAFSRVPGLRLQDWTLGPQLL